MTVAELIKILQTMPQDLTVVSLGADCGGYDVETGDNITVEQCIVYGVSTGIHDENSNLGAVVIQHNSYS